ncbi:MAG: toll/interleukin-1 receptor domain-containing protein [Candidatus Hydrogenedentes bacterium]|nr:toll/interleukin-1 receptor domain-containing protein [Candidatus Hydrogenedentota bacterium]
MFASYAHKDGRQVFPELRALHDQAVRIWYDEGIDPGNEWPDDIARALHKASVFLVFVSQSAVESRNVRNEINFALNRGKPFLAIYLEDVQLPPGLELRMGDIQAVMKWRMTPEHYSRKIMSALPPTVIRAEPRAATALPPAPSVFTVKWSCRLKEALYSPIRALVSTGRELLCISPGSADFWVQAIHQHDGKLLWRVPSADHRVVWDRIAWTASYLYLTGDVEVEPDLRFARKIDLREGDVLASVSWYNVPAYAHQVRDKIPEWDQLPWRPVRDVEHQGQMAKTSALEVSVLDGRVHIEDLRKSGAYDWVTPADDPVTSVTIHGESNPVVAFSSGRICLLSDAKPT